MQMKKRTKVSLITSISQQLMKWTHHKVFKEYLTLKIADGHKLIYEREVPFELRIHDGDTGPQEVGTLEAIKVKVLLLVPKFTTYHLLEWRKQRYWTCKVRINFRERSLLSLLYSV